jgi:sigma-B regulation protein RsbU (phosphoserine phosphatase)
MLGVLNRRLCGTGISPGFVAMLFAVFNEEKGHLVIGNGGIPHPILARDGEVKEIPIDGTPLGLFKEISYGEHTIDMRPGDIVVLASDGITESMSATGELFGFERLAGILCEFTRKKASGDAPVAATSAEISAAILAATDAFSGNPSEPHDDRTLIVLRLAGKKA